MEWIESDFKLESVGDSKWFWDLRVLTTKRNGTEDFSDPMYSLPLPIAIRYIASFRAEGNTLEEHLRLWKKEMCILIKKCKELKIL